MKASRASLDGIILIELDEYLDERGIFFETYQVMRYHQIGILDEFVQDNYSRSKKDVLRGMHFQNINPQAQLVTLIYGCVFDVVIDVRKNSPTFGNWFGMELSLKGVRQINMPPGFAHGFLVLSEFADMHYKVTSSYNPENEGGILWNDPDVSIKWPITEPIVTSKDLSFKNLKDSIIDY